MTDFREPHSDAARPRFLRILEDVLQREVPEQAAATLEDVRRRHVPRPLLEAAAAACRAAAADIENGRPSPDLVRALAKVAAHAVRLMEAGYLLL